MHNIFRNTCKNTLNEINFVLGIHDDCMIANNTILGCKETSCFNVLETLFIFTFSPQTVGVIVRLEKENFQVLSMHNKVNLPHYKLYLPLLLSNICIFCYC